MKSLIKIQYLILLSIIIICSDQFNSLAQGTGNHVTMILKNCTQIDPATLQFELYVVSDGASTSDLRLNAVQYGVNFNTGILPSGATISISYLNGTTDTIYPSGGTSFSFPNSNFLGHIRIVQCPSGVNSGKTMVIGHEYRIGVFQLSCSMSWVSSSNPNFSLQDSIALCKTVCATDAYIDTTCWGTIFYINGTTDSLRSVRTDSCNLILNSVNELTQSGISIYPNLIDGEGSVHISLQKNISDGRVYIFNALGQKVFENAFNGREKTVNCKLPAGVYFLQVRDGESQYAQKLVVQ